MEMRNLIETKWQELKSWYTDLVDWIAEGLKMMLLSLPKATLGILGFLIFMLGLMKIGWWMVPIYIGLLFFGVIIYVKFFEEKDKVMENSDE